MGTLSGGYGGLWGLPPFHSNQGRRRSDRRKEKAKPSDSADSATGAPGYRFPLKQAATAGSLALAGDTIAQLRGRWVKSQALKQRVLSDHDDDSFKDDVMCLLSNHDWLRALRMTSYGFLLYGPGSYAWYQFLDRCMPKQSVNNILLKVLLNQIVLGPSVIAVVFAWNNLWQGKLSELPNKYKKDALPTLLTGFRFWIPVSVLNFWITRNYRVVPLQARVAFMSMGSIFWNFCLSSTMSKQKIEFYGKREVWQQWFMSLSFMQGIHSLKRTIALWINTGTRNGILSSMLDLWRRILLL